MAKRAILTALSSGIILLAVALPCVSAADDKEADSSAVLGAMHAIREAARRGDVRPWQKLVDAECRFVEPAGRITSRAWHAPRAATSGDRTQTSISQEVKLSQEQVFVHGETAVLVYREDVTANIGGLTISTHTRFSETYRRIDGAWRMILSAETPIKEKVAVKVDPAVLGDYVGEYQMAPNVVGKVFRDGERLLLIGTGWKQAYELLPLGSDAFFVKEMPDNEIMFVRDTAGKVIAQTAGGDGPGITGKKIR